MLSSYNISALLFLRCLIFLLVATRPHIYPSIQASWQWLLWQPCDVTPRAILYTGRGPLVLSIDVRLTWGEIDFEAGGSTRPLKLISTCSVFRFLLSTIFTNDSSHRRERLYRFILAVTLKLETVSTNLKSIKSCYLTDRTRLKKTFSSKWSTF